MKKLFLNLIGPLFAATGVIGLAGSGILWNFQGRPLGLTATVISLLVLMVGVVLLRPLAPSSSATPVPAASAPAAPEIDSVAPAEEITTPTITTAESIERELAEYQKQIVQAPQVNFAPKILLPGQGLLSPRRRPGASLKSYKKMAGELFSS